MVRPQQQQRKQSCMCADAQLTLNFKILYLLCAQYLSQDDRRQAHSTESSSKKRRKSTSNPNSSSSVSGAGSGWVRIVDAVKRNECRFFAQLLLEDYLVNQVSTPLSFIVVIIMYRDIHFQSYKKFYRNYL